MYQSGPGRREKEEHTVTIISDEEELRRHLLWRESNYPHMQWVLMIGLIVQDQKSHGC